MRPVLGFVVAHLVLIAPGLLLLWCTSMIAPRVRPALLAIGPALPPRRRAHVPGHATAGDHRHPPLAGLHAGRRRPAVRRAVGDRPPSRPGAPAARPGRVPHRGRAPPGLARHRHHRRLVRARVAVLRPAAHAGRRRAHLVAAHGGAVLLRRPAEGDVHRNGLLHQPSGLPAALASVELDDLPLHGRRGPAPGPPGAVDLHGRVRVDGRLGAVQRRPAHRRLAALRRRAADAHAGGRQHRPGQRRHIGGGLQRGRRAAHRAVAGGRARRPGGARRGTAGRRGDDGRTRA